MLNYEYSLPGLLCKYSDRYSTLKYSLYEEDRIYFKSSTTVPFNKGTIVSATCRIPSAAGVPQSPEVAEKLTKQLVNNTSDPSNRPIEL